MLERLKSHCWWLISGANQSLCVNHANFNLSNWINIQGEGAQEVGGGICKNMITQSKGGRLIVKLLNSAHPLDVDPVAQIEVCTVCTEILVCT